MSEDDDFDFETVTTPQPMSILKLKHKILQAAGRVFRILGPGFHEKIYEEAMVKEIQDMGIPYTQQQTMPVYYKETCIGTIISDIIVDNKLVLELKANKSKATKQHVHQCRGYMRSLRIEHGLVLNFPQSRPCTAMMDAFDCHTGAEVTVEKVEQCIQEAADANTLGPAPNEKPVMPVTHMESFMIQPTKKRAIEHTAEAEAWFEFPNGSRAHFKSQ